MINERIADLSASLSTFSMETIDDEIKAENTVASANQAAADILQQLSQDLNELGPGIQDTPIDDILGDKIDKITKPDPGTLGTTSTSTTFATPSP